MTKQEYNEVVALAWRLRRMCYTSKEDYLTQAPLRAAGAATLEILAFRLLRAETIECHIRALRVGNGEAVTSTVVTSIIEDARREHQAWQQRAAELRRLLLVVSVGFAGLFLQTILLWRL